MAQMTMGQRIAQERKKLGLSQEALGEKMGVSRQSISKWESDGAVPEIDKLIALSKLYSVSVGWLLGVEELPEKQENELSEVQLKVVDRLVKQALPSSEWKTVAAMALTVFALLVSFVMAKQLRDSAIQTRTSENQITALANQVEGIGSRLSVLEAAVLNPGQQLLAEYSIKVSAGTSGNGDDTANLAFTAVPNSWLQGDAGYLCISGGNEPDSRIACQWDGTHLTASTTLPVSPHREKYTVCFVVEHESGFQEQQILEDEDIDDLGNRFTIPAELDVGGIRFENGAQEQQSLENEAIGAPENRLPISGAVEAGDIRFENGQLILTDFAVRFDLPPVFEDVGDAPFVESCEYLLQRRPLVDTAYVNQTVSVLEELSTDYDVDEDMRILAVHYSVSSPEVRFQDVDITDCDHIHLKFRVTLSNGMERTLPITTLVPDGQGGLE